MANTFSELRPELDAILNPGNGKTSENSQRLADAVKSAYADFLTANGLPVGEAPQNALGAGLRVLYESYPGEQTVTSRQDASAPVVVTTPYVAKPLVTDTPKEVK